MKWSQDRGTIEENQSGIDGRSERVQDTPWLPGLVGTEGGGETRFGQTGRRFERSQSDRQKTGIRPVDRLHGAVECGQRPNLDARYRNHTPPKHEVEFDAPAGWKLDLHLEGVGP